MKEMETLSQHQREKGGLRDIVEIDFVMLTAPTGNAPALTVQDLCCRKRRNNIFNDIQFAVYSGQITAITGHNGAGKTSLALVLSGLWKESSGTIEILGKHCSARQRRRAIWYSSNDTGTQFFANSVTEELLLNSDRNSERLDQGRMLLKELGLYEYKDVHPATLSGGQKQRLSIACGILSNRKILIFDEPTSSLDGRNMRIIAKVLRRQAADGKTVLIITHDIEW